LYCKKEKGQHPSNWGRIKRTEQQAVDLPPSCTLFPSSVLHISFMLARLYAHRIVDSDVTFTSDVYFGLEGNTEVDRRCIELSWRVKPCRGMKVSRHFAKCHSCHIEGV
jgi:hypothetical protein